MLNTHSREDAFDCPSPVVGRVVFSGDTGSPTFSLPLVDPEARTEAQDIALRDALLRRYPLAPVVSYRVYSWGSDINPQWAVAQDTEAVTRVTTTIADHLTEEHAHIFADTMNAKVRA